MLFPGHEILLKKKKKDLQIWLSTNSSHPNLGGPANLHNHTCIHQILYNCGYKSFHFPQSLMLMLPPSPSTYWENPDNLSSEIPSFSSPPQKSLFSFCSFHLITEKDILLFPHSHVASLSVPGILSPHVSSRILSHLSAFAVACLVILIAGSFRLSTNLAELQHFVFFL